MTKMVLKFILNCFALFFVMKLIPGIHIDKFTSLLLATIVIGVLNTFLRPLIILLTLPVTMMTLGLFTLVINGVIFYLSAHLVNGFKVDNFGVALFAAILFSIFSFILNMIFRTK